MWAATPTYDGLTRPSKQKFGKPVGMPVSESGQKESLKVSASSIGGKENMPPTTKGPATPPQVRTPKPVGLGESRWARTTVPPVSSSHGKPPVTPIVTSTPTTPTEITPPRRKLSPLAAEFKPGFIKQDGPSANPPEETASNPGKAPSVVSVDTESRCSPEIVMPSAKASDELARISSTESGNTPNKDKSLSASGSANTDNTPISPVDSSKKADNSSKTDERPIPVTTASPAHAIKNSTKGTDTVESSSTALKETSGNAQSKAKPPTSSSQKAKSIKETSNNAQLKASPSTSGSPEPQSTKTSDSSTLKVESKTQVVKAPKTKLENATKATVKTEEPSISNPQKAGWVAPEKRLPRGTKVSPPPSKAKQTVKTVSPGKNQPGYVPPHERHLHSAPKVATPSGVQVAGKNTAVTQPKAANPTVTQAKPVIKSQAESTKEAAKYIPPHERHLHQEPKTTDKLPPHLRAINEPTEAKVKKLVEEPKKGKTKWRTTLIVKTNEDGVVEEFKEVPREETKKPKASGSGTVSTAKPSESKTGSKTESTQSVAITKSNESSPTKDAQKDTDVALKTRDEPKLSSAEQKATVKSDAKPMHKAANYVPPHMRHLTSPIPIEAKKPTVIVEDKATVTSGVKSTAKSADYVPPHMRHLTAPTQTEAKKPSVTVEDKVAVKSEVNSAKSANYVPPHLRDLSAPTQTEVKKPEEEQKKAEGKSQAEDVSHDVKKENDNVVEGYDTVAAQVKPTVAEQAPAQSEPKPKPEEAQVTDVVTQPIAVTSEVQTTDTVKAPSEREAEVKPEVEPVAKTDGIAPPSQKVETLVKATPSPEPKAEEPTKAAEVIITPHLTSVLDTKSTHSSVSAAVEEPKKTQSKVSSEAKKEDTAPRVESPAQEVKIVNQQKVDPLTGKIVPPHLWHTLTPVSSPPAATKDEQQESASELQHLVGSKQITPPESISLTETTAVVLEQKPNANHSEHESTTPDLKPLETHKSISPASAKVVNTTSNTSDEEPKEKEESLLPPHIRYGMLYKKSTTPTPTNTVDTTSKASDKAAAVEKSNKEHATPPPSAKAINKNKPSITESAVKKGSKQPTASLPKNVADSTASSDEKVKDSMPETYVPPHIRYQANYNPNAQPAQPCNGQVDSNTDKGESRQNGLQTPDVKNAEADATCTGEELTDDSDARQEMALVPYVANAQPNFTVCMYGSIGGSQTDNSVGQLLRVRSDVDAMPKALDAALPAHVQDGPAATQSHRPPPRSKEKEDGTLVKSNRSSGHQKTPSYYQPGAVWMEYETGMIRTIADIHSIWTHPMLRQLPIRHVRCLPKTELVQEIGRDRELFIPPSCTMINLDMSDSSAGSMVTILPHEAIMPDRFKPSHMDRCLPRIPLADIAAAGIIHDKEKTEGRGYPLPYKVRCDYFKQRKRHYGRRLDETMDLLLPGTTISFLHIEDLGRFYLWATDLVDSALATPILVDKNDPNFLSGIKPVSGTADVCADIPTELHWLPTLPPNFDEEDWDTEKEKCCKAQLDTFREVSPRRRELVRYQTSATKMEQKVAEATQVMKEKKRQKEEARVSKLYQLSDPTKIRPHDPFGPPKEKDNPMDPEVDIFLRPARPNETDQIAERYNEIALRSSDIPDNGYTPKEYFDEILAYCNSQKLPFIVACSQSSRQRNRRRKHMGPQVYREVIVGLAYVKPFRPEANFAGTVELFVIVDRYIRRKGIGQNLMDRILPALDRKYISHCATWFYPEDHDKSEFVNGGSEKVRKIVLSVYHEDNDFGVSKLAWKSRVLETFGFLPYANFYNIGAYDTGVNGETRGQP